jgi:methionyl-tRNA formyltransferase
MTEKVIIFGKDKPGRKDALAFLEDRGCEVAYFQGEVGDPFPEEAYGRESDIIISYISPWIIDAKMLRRARKWAINFHPGPPEYPGIGCTNFALYNEEREFGVTAHVMAPKVDTGPILGVRRFPLLPADTVASLTARCYEHILALFREIMTHILDKQALPECTEQWRRAPYTRKELNALCRCTPDMPLAELRRRIRATVFPGRPGPYIMVDNFKFVLNEE